MSTNTWNLSALLQSDTDPTMIQEQQAISEAINSFAQKWESRNDYLQQTLPLKEALDEYNALMTQYGLSGRSGYYFHLRHTQDQIDSELKAQNQKITDFSIVQHQKIQFFELRLAKISQNDQQHFLQSELLTPYHHYLERIFIMQKHVLSEKEEHILTVKSQTSHSKWVQLTSSLLSKETRKITVDQKIEELPFEQLLKTASFHKDEKTRDEATSNINQIFDKLADVAENEINAILQDKKVTDELRGYDRPDQSRHLADDIETKVVDSMIQAVSSRYDISHQFYKLKAKALGKKSLKYNEKNLDVGEINRTYSWEESCKLVINVFHKLDPQFANIAQMLIDNGQVDVYPRKGKVGGAFCSGNLISHPTYVLLNHTDKLNDVLTIAHEFGHAINNELMKTHVNALNFDTPLSTAEVASTFMEDFVLQEIEKTADQSTRQALIFQKLNDDVSTIFRQVACYQFEKALHQQFRQKGYLSKTEIGIIFQQHMSAYMGDAIDQPEWAQNWWIYWSHIRSFFYVYSYASGLLISKSLQAMVKQDPISIHKVKAFLSAGTTKSPKDIFAEMAIDITDQNFWLKGLAEIEGELNTSTELAIN